MAIATKSKYNVALDGQGFILQGLPDRPAYVTAQAPVYGTRFASGDRDYNDLSQWWYLTQTDWSGGIKASLSFADDAKFHYSNNVDAWSETGKIKLSLAQSLVNDFSEQVTCANVGFNNDDPNRYYGTAVGGGGEPVLYEETVASPGTFTDIGASVYDSADTAISHIFSNLDTVFALAVGTDQTGTVVVRKGTSTSDVTSNADSVVTLSSQSSRCGCSINGVAYIFLDNNTESYSLVKTAVDNPTTNADWTLVFNSANGTPIAACEYQGNLYYLVLKGASTYIELRVFDVSSSTDVAIQSFYNITLAREYGLNNLLRVLQGKLLVTIPSEEVWEMDSSNNLTRIYRRDVTKKNLDPEVCTANLAYGCIVSQQRAWWGNLVYDGTAFFNTERPSDDSATNTTYPLFTDVDDSRFMGESLDTSKVYKIDPDGTSYKTGTSDTAFLVFSQHDKMQSIDKLMHNVNIGFDQLASGQEIEVYYSTLPYPTPSISDWTLLGEATYSADGATVTSKTLPFVDGVNPKKIWFRVQFKGGGSNTPALTDFTLEYLPIPDYRRQWVININAGDSVMRLDGSNETRSGREMAGFLEHLWLTKDVFEYQDVEYAATQLNGAINSSATTITVDDTADFPERGRLVVDSEEIFYTGKTPNSFTGCVRARQGTVAVSHSDNATISTGLFKAIVTNFQRQIPILQRGKDIESVIQLSIRETGL